MGACGASRLQRAPPNRPRCPTMTDPDLDQVQRAIAGDTEAFGELVEKYQPIMAAMLHRFAASQADLEDLVQDSFIKAWKALPRWKPKQPFSHWLKRIGANTGLDYCRRRKRSPITPVAELPETRETSANDSSNEALDEARQLLAKLPADEGALLTLVYLNGMSMKEAAEHFGWSTGKAKIRAFRARKFLRQTLRNNGYSRI